MGHPFDITSPSPDGQHMAHFAVGGEIRFGPLYFSLSVDGYSFDQRIFGDVHLWSPASNMLAVQEWLTLDYSEGPITALVLLDLSLGRAAPVARVTKGFVVPEAFEGPTIVYRKEYAGQHDGQHFRLDSTKIAEWNTLG